MLAFKFDKSIDIGAVEGETKKEVRGRLVDAAEMMVAEHRSHPDGKTPPTPHAEPINPTPKDPQGTQ